MISVTTGILAALILFGGSSLQASELAKPCAKLSIVDSLISELTKDIENLSRHKAKKLAKELILRQCRHEKEKGKEDIRIRNDKVIFSEYSHTFDTNDPVYFCKNNIGYKSYLSHMTHRLIQFKINQEGPKQEKKRKPSSRKSRPVVRTPEKKKATGWDCVIPGYLKIVKKVDKAQMETLSITYGESSCSPSRS